MIRRAARECKVFRSPSSWVLASLVALMGFLMWPPVGLLVLVFFFFAAPRYIRVWQVDSPFGWGPWFFKPAAALEFVNEEIAGNSDNGETVVPFTYAELRSLVLPGREVRHGDWVIICRDVPAKDADLEWSGW